MRVIKIKSMAQGHFKLNEGKELVTYCVTKGCNMLVPLTQAGASPEQKKAAGGYVLFCEHCNLSFCLECSEKIGEVVALHKGLSCAISSFTDHRLRAMSVANDALRLPAHLRTGILWVRWLLFTLLSQV